MIFSFWATIFGGDGVGGVGVRFLKTKTVGAPPRDKSQAFG